MRGGARAENALGARGEQGFLRLPACRSLAIGGGGHSRLLPGQLTQMPSGESRRARCRPTPLIGVDQDTSATRHPKSSAIGQDRHPLLDGVLSLFSSALSEGRGGEDWSTVNPSAAR